MKVKSFCSSEDSTMDSEMTVHKLSKVISNTYGRQQHIKQERHHFADKGSYSHWKKLWFSQ